MATNFLLELKKPILALAPMEGSSWSRHTAGVHELLHARPARRATPCSYPKYYKPLHGTGVARAPDSGTKAISA